LTDKFALSPYEIAALAANLADEKKALDISMLDTAKVSYLADYFVICSGESAAQIQAITETIKSALNKMGIAPLGEEKDGNKRWNLLDYGDVVIHVMHPQERQFYQLEQFWNHANVVSQALWQQDARKAS
jgi:ribosome-associated protein